ncbi:MAG: glycoside hydrolase family 78 protein [Bacteroidales bacterium]
MQKILNRKIALAILFSFFLGVPFINAQFVVDLKCEYLENSLGIDNPSPRFSWKINDIRQDAYQTAFQIIVGTDSIEVQHDQGDVWDTKKIDSQDILVTYAGKKLEPFTRYYWKVISWGVNGSKSSSLVNFFETGMMSVENWQGSWIGDGRDIHYKSAPCFRKKFRVENNIKSARAYIAVAGLYELYINGEKIGNHRLDPMYTRFDRRNLYVTYDITSQIKSGDNVVGVLLGNGWYNHQSKAVWDFDRAPWRKRPAFCLDLRIVYEDGSEESIVTDQTWKKNDSPITFNSIYTGEHYDARLECGGWSSPRFDDSKWHGVSYRGAPSPVLVSQQLRPIRNVSEFVAKSFKKFDDRTYLFDFGQNMAGVTKLKIMGDEGTELKIKHGERLYENGRLDMSNIDVYYRGDKEEEPFQTDIVTLSGKGEDEFMAKFNYKGFRYVEITSNAPVNLTEKSLVAYFMHSDVPSVGKIEASNPIVEKLWEATNNAYLSNLMGYPTDCPQREKNGWTGDAHFAIETALYNFDGITIYEKWLADHRDEQQPNGVLPDIIPTGGWGYGSDNGLDWTSTIAIIPWNLYLFYGDSKPLRDCYENIKRYVDYVDRNSPNHLTSWGRGDWVPVKTHSNKELTSSVYFYVDVRILANTAKLFNKTSDYEYYSKLTEKIKTAINEKYLNKEAGIYANGSQTELSVPLQWGVVPKELIPKVAKNLSKKVEDADFHLDVGVLGAKAILNALSGNGYAETAYRVAVQDTYPSWGWWVKNGATTLLENWDLEAKRDISDNHMMFGEIGGWFFKGLGGIFPDDEKPGFKHIILRPNFVRDLTDFEAKYESPYGEIISKWKRNGEKVKYEVLIPANSEATLYLPEKGKEVREVELKSGKYIFNLEVKN